jgi:hypothetical protein
MFFGTPHFGSDRSQWLSIAEALGQVSTKTRGKPSTLVEAMTQNARGLSDISEDFVHVAPKYAIKTVYETLPLEAAGQVIVPMMSTRMFGHKQDEVPIDADHLSMCQFSHTDDVDFLMVSSFIRKTAGGEVRRPTAATAARWELEEVKIHTGQPTQRNQTSKTQIGHILGQPLYIDSPSMRQRPSTFVESTQNTTKALPSIVSSHEQPFLPAPAGRNKLDTEAHAVAVPLALPASTPQLPRMDMPLPRAVPVKCESDSAVKQPRWFSRVMGGIRHKGR